MYTTCIGLIKDGLFCRKINIELDLSRGIFSFLIVGLADKCIGESKERIISAIKNSGFGSIKTENHKVTVSLAPAGIKKEGVLLDLPIAISYLMSTQKIHSDRTQQCVFVGELGLDGSIKNNDFIAPIVKCVIDNNKNPQNPILCKIFGKFKNDDINLIKNTLKQNRVEIINVNNLQEAVAAINKRDAIDDTPKRDIEAELLHIDSNLPQRCLKTISVKKDGPYIIDKIIGLEKAKRAILIAVCGKYNLIFAGPPGVGKTMLSKCTHELLPIPTESEVLDLLTINTSTARPFRSPHHTSSYSSIIGGGNPISPGEITLANHGILFLDELPEFNKTILESLRQPLEEKNIQINRSGEIINFPCNSMCIGAMNLCPCGNKGIPNKNCVCNYLYRNKYIQKISQPLLERFHIIINLSLQNGTDKTQFSTYDYFTKIISRYESYIENNKINVGIQWNDNALQELENRCVKLFYSTRVKIHIKNISETISIIKNIEKELFREEMSVYDKEYTKEKDKLIIHQDKKIITNPTVTIDDVIEAFSYRENLN